MSWNSFTSSSLLRNLLTLTHGEVLSVRVNLASQESPSTAPRFLASITYHFPPGFIHPVSHHPVFTRSDPRSPGRCLQLLLQLLAKGPEINGGRLRSQQCQFRKSVHGSSPKVWGPKGPNGAVPLELWKGQARRDTELIMEFHSTEDVLHRNRTAVETVPLLNSECFQWRAMKAKSQYINLKKITEPGRLHI